MKTSRISSQGWSAALCGGLLLLAQAAAAGSAGDGRGDDHDRARQALEAGEILPLRTILERVERDYPGQIMEVELERRDGCWVYEIKLLRSGGTLVKLRIDARDGDVTGVRKKESRREIGGEHHGERR